MGTTQLNQKLNKTAFKMQNPYGNLPPFLNSMQVNYLHQLSVSVFSPLLYDIYEMNCKRF